MNPFSEADWTTHFQLIFIFWYRSNYSFWFSNTDRISHTFVLFQSILFLLYFITFLTKFIILSAFKVLFRASDFIYLYILHIRIHQVMMLRAKFGRIRIRTNLLQRWDNNFCHFSNKFWYKLDKTIYNFSKKIADCCSSRLATLPQKDCKNLLKFVLKFLKKLS